MRRSLVAAAVGLSLMAACSAAPAPLGEALIVVQTDVAVPYRVGRLRIEVSDYRGGLVTSREVITPTASEWPVSFSVVGSGDAYEEDFFLRLRAYPEGHDISTHDLETFGRQSPRYTTVYASIEEACEQAPALELDKAITLRRGSTPITSVLRSNALDGTGSCLRTTNAGSAVARIDIAEAGEYAFEVVASTPDGAHGNEYGDTTISLRTSCALPTTQIACADDILPPDNLLSRVQRDLQPGRYYVVTGGHWSATADLTIRATRAGVIAPVASGPEAPPNNLASLTPAPGVTIDRLMIVHVKPGERGNVEVTLHGECFGTPADLVNRTTCVDLAGQRVPVTTEAPRPPLTPPGAPIEPSWRGDVRVPCSAVPRADGPTFDGEVCVPGGAFILGDTLALVDLDRRAQPERMRVVEPFLIDKYEFTVGRFRDALRRGFKSPDLAADGRLRDGDRSDRGEPRPPGELAGEHVAGRPARPLPLRRAPRRGLRARRLVLLR